MADDRLFSRNLGVLTPDQQERLRRSRVLVVGCGGVGETVALALARSGVERFTLVDFDSFEPSNMNRQMCCRKDTLGRNKATVTAEAIAAINTRAATQVRSTRLELPQLAALMPGHDLVLAAADDFAYSVCALRLCRQHGITGLVVVPSGLWAMATLLDPHGCTVERLFGLPAEADYAELNEIFTDPFYRLAAFFYVMVGRWRADYFVDFVRQAVPLAQLCPVVWSASSLAALEAVKRLSGAGEAVCAPRFWWLSPGGSGIRALNRPNVQTLAVLHRRVAWALLRSPAGPALRKGTWWCWERLAGRGGIRRSGP
jgi:molybdopterin/thiamine biosynthesis adenylyltransferase